MAIRENFPNEIWGHGIFWRHQRAIRESFLPENLTNLRKFIVSHQPLTRFACGRTVIIHYSLLANAITTWQIHSTTAIKSGRVIAWKAIMTVEVGTDAKQ